MVVEFTQDAEVRRVEKERTNWELFSSTSLVHALHKARDLGWKDKKIQVRVEHVASDMLNYIIEPFERDCNCPSMLRYSDYFD